MPTPSTIIREMIEERKYKRENFGVGDEELAEEKILEEVLERIDSISGKIGNYYWQSIYDSFPKYGEYVLVIGTDGYGIYGDVGYHVCILNELADGKYNWTTRRGDVITNVSFWTHITS